MDEPSPKRPSRTAPTRTTESAETNRSTADSAKKSTKIPWWESVYSWSQQDFLIGALLVATVVWFLWSVIDNGKIPLI